MLSGPHLATGSEDMQGRNGWDGGEEPWPVLTGGPGSQDEQER